MRRYPKNLDAGFMVPTAEYLTAEEASEYLRNWDDEAFSCEPGLQEAGWYSRLSAPGYMDCTGWDGPYPRAWRALKAVCRMYDVDIRGNMAT